ncbi:MAG: molybdenum ABC transporter ATP-binding protein [Phycisphaerales bacterium]
MNTLTCTINHAVGRFQLNVDFATDAGILGVFGPSGAGKSTLLRLIAGVRTPDHGCVQVASETLFDIDSSVNVAAHARRIGMVFQEPRLFPHMTVHANLLAGVPRSKRNRGPLQALIAEVVERLELGALLESQPRELSGGEQQRVAVARAVLAQPRLLLLDEPLSSLDATRTTAALALLRDMHVRLQLPMVYVSHDLTEIRRLTDQLLLLDNGCMVGVGSFARLVADGKSFAALRRGAGVMNLIRGTIREHDHVGGLSLIAINDADVEAAALAVPLLAGRAVGTSTLHGVTASDVALSLQRLEGISIRNQIPAEIVRLHTHDRRTIVEVDIGASTPLLVEISHATVRELGLEDAAEEKQWIWCLIKSSALQEFPSGS